MKIAIVLGTRPEIIKLASIILYCQGNNLDYLLIHTNQHYNYELDKIFFEELNLPQPHYNLDVGSKSPAAQTGEMLAKIEEILIKEQPGIVIVQGDTNSTLAGALAGVKNNVKVAHIEAGLRSYDRRMPEELNRVMVDHIADFLFAPTDISKKNLLKEGIDEKKIYVIGNTVVDAFLHNLPLAEMKKGIVESFSLQKKGYFLVTAHRQENLTSKENIHTLFSAFDELSKRHAMPVFFPVHPRTKKFIQENCIKVPPSVKLVDPIGYLEFLMLEKHAFLILTDSGGIQEEACLLKTPCITLRDNTERPETLGVGSNMLAGLHKEKILSAVKEMSKRKADWKNPFGDGKSGEKAMRILSSFFSG